MVDTRTCHTYSPPIFSSLRSLPLPSPLTLTTLPPSPAPSSIPAHPLLCPRTSAPIRYVSNEDFEKAVACYRHALRLDNRHYNAW